jgi:hypothetical protein
VTRAFGPLFYHTDDSEKRTSFNIVGPFYYASSPHQHDSGLAPLVFTRTHDDGRWAATIVPLLHVARKSDGVRLITPLFGFSTYPSGSRGFIGPIYFRKDSDGYTGAVIPVFYQTRDHLAGSFTSLLIPLYLHTESHDSSLTAVTPLIWRHKSIESGTTLVLPLFFDHHVYHESRTTGLLPFYIQRRGIAEGATTHVIPPLLLYVRRAPEGTDVAFFPLVWRFVSKGEVDSSTTIVAPLFWDFKRGTSHTQVLFPLYMHATRPNADHTIVANVYYRRGKGPTAGSYYVNVFPFFDFGRPRPGDVEWNIFGGVIGYSRIGNNRTLKLFFGLEIPLASPVVATSPTGSFFGTASAARNELF